MTLDLDNLPADPEMRELRAALETVREEVAAMRAKLAQRYAVPADAVPVRFRETSQ
jgi:hypothetical protein